VNPHEDKRTDHESNACRCGKQCDLNHELPTGLLGAISVGPVPMKGKGSDGAGKETDVVGSQRGCECGVGKTQQEDFLDCRSDNSAEQGVKQKQELLKERRQ
jgi:hypothetical protein